MRTTTRIAVALSVPLALLAAGPSAIAAAPQHPPAEPSRLRRWPGAVPADFVTLTDDTGTISVGLPELVDRRRDSAPRRRAERPGRARPAGVPLAVGRPRRHPAGGAVHQRHRPEQLRDRDHVRRPGGGGL